MLGIRGSLYDPDDLTWAREQGVTIIGSCCGMGPEYTLELKNNFI